MDLFSRRSIQLEVVGRKSGDSRGGKEVPDLDPAGGVMRWSEHLPTRSPTTSECPYLYPIARNEGYDSRFLFKGAMRNGK